ncbi:MAG: hypothetical protein AB8G77_26380 [Rhodothermales bacterium]
MNIIKLAALTVAAIVSTGCATTSQFNSNIRGVTFVNEKPYLVPFGVTLSQTPIGNKYLAFLNSQKIYHCKKGDILWTEKSYLKYALKTRDNNTVQPGFAAQRMGCSSPLSDREYDYYRTAMVERAQQARHQEKLEMQQLAVTTNQTSN